MAHSYLHAENSAKKFGGKAEDYTKIHDWFDASKASFADARHRALRHHSEGIFACEEVFGHFIINSDGKKVMVRIIGEQHVREDFGWIPSFADWANGMPLRPWMTNGAAAFEITDVWSWVKIFNPDLYISRQVLDLTGE